MQNECSLCQGVNKEFASRDECPACGPTSANAAVVVPPPRPLRRGGVARRIPREVLADAVHKSEPRVLEYA